MICNKITYPQRDALHVTHYCCSSVLNSPFVVSLSYSFSANTVPVSHSFIVMDFLWWNFFFWELWGELFLLFDNRVCKNFDHTIFARLLLSFHFHLFVICCYAVRRLVARAYNHGTNFEKPDSKRVGIKRTNNSWIANNSHQHDSHITFSYIRVSVVRNSCMYSINSFNFIVSIFYHRYMHKHIQKDVMVLSSHFITSLSGRMYEYVFCLFIAKCVHSLITSS